MKNEKFIDESIKKICQHGGRILDVGGGRRFDKWLEKYEKEFVGCEYLTMDYDDSTSPDVIGDIHKIPLADCSVNSVICSSVLEHVADPQKAVDEIFRILKDGGFGYFYVPSIYPYHAKKGHYPDYWRFFDDTLILLFRNFKDVKLEKKGGYFLALSLFFPFQNNFRSILDVVSTLLDGLFRTNKKTTTAGYFVLVRK